MSDLLHWIGSALFLWSCILFALQAMRPRRDDESARDRWGSTRIRIGLSSEDKLKSS
jgi:hypothetical protein